MPSGVGWATDGNVLGLRSCDSRCPPPRPTQPSPLPTRKLDRRPDRGGHGGGRGRAVTLKDQIALLEAEVARLNNDNREDFEREQGSVDQLLSELLTATGNFMRAKDATERLKGEVAVLRVQRKVILNQQAIIALLKGQGWDTTNAERALELFEQSLVMFEYHLKAVERAARRAG